MKARNIIIPLLLLLAIRPASFGQAPGKETVTAFSGNEKLTYVISYKFGIINAELADVVFNVKTVTVDGVPAYHLNAVGRVIPSYKFFFDMRDEYNTWLRCDNLLPIKFNNNIKEGSYRFQSSMTYDWNKKVVNTQYKNLRIGIDYSKQMNLTASSFDGLAMFYNLRNTKLEDIKDGFKGYIDLVSCDTIERLRYQFIGREVKDIPRAGKFNTLKFSCQITSSEAESFKEGSEFFIWLSDDNNKIPLYIESPIKVGSVKGRLLKHENLKHPLTSKIK